MECKKTEHKKFDLNKKKKIAIKSLYEINCFLNKLNTVKKIKEIKDLIKNK